MLRFNIYLSNNTHNNIQSCRNTEYYAIQSIITECLPSCRWPGGLPAANY